MLSSGETLAADSISLVPITSRLSKSDPYVKRTLRMSSLFLESIFRHESNADIKVSCTNFAFLNFGLVWGKRSRQKSVPTSLLKVFDSDLLPRIPHKSLSKNDFTSFLFSLLKALIIAETMIDFFGADDLAIDVDSIIPTRLRIRAIRDRVRPLERSSHKISTN